MQLRDAIENRKSVKRFHHAKPDWRKIIRAIDAARFAPAAGNQFVMRFILVSDEKKISKIAAATQQDFVGKVHYIVVAVADDSSLVRDFGERAVRYCAQQSGAAIENFLLALVAQGLCTTWVGHFVDDQIQRALDIPDNIKVEAVFPIGIEAKVGSKRARKMALENIIYFDKFGNKKMKPSIKVSRQAY